MKRIASTLVILTLAGTAAAAMAADTPYPSSAQQETPLSQEFPNMDTYKKEHRAGRNDPAGASNTPTFPSSVPSETSLSDEGLVPGVAGVPPYDNRGAVGGTR